MNTIFSKTDGDEMLAKIGVNTEVLSEEEKQEMLEQIDAHMNRVILESTVGSLSSTQIERLSSVLSSGDEESFLYELEETAKQIPGLLTKIESAVEEEFKMLALAKKQLN